MFDKVMDWLSSGAAGDGRAPDESQMRTAAAALLVHCAYVDGTVDLAEDTCVRRCLAEKFALSAPDVNALMDAAERKESEAVDLYGFTSVLTRELDQAGRQDVVRMLWQVVLADSVVHDYEDTLVRRVSDLLGVSTRDRVRLRKEVENARIRGAGA